MTNPQDPYGYNPFTYDPLGRVPLEPPPGPPVFAPPPPPPYRPPVNTLATLSLVFAFVFAPVGAILGHLGLSQIRRTGEPGRGRAMLGLALSYAFIALTVGALAVWATLTTAASTSRQTAAPATTTTTSAPVATVDPAAVATLVPGVDALKNITGDQNLAAGPTWDHPDKSFKEGTIDRTECWGSVTPGAPDVYGGVPLAGYRGAEFSDTRSFLKSTQVLAAVAAFRDPPAAQSQLAKLLSGWRRCGGSTVTVTMPEGQPIAFSVSAPADAGDGITTLDLTPRGVQVRSARAIAAKANIVIDLSVSCSGTTDSERPRRSAVSIANDILGKIPG